jgi:hypothetical protein
MGVNREGMTEAEAAGESAKYGSNCCVTAPIWTVGSMLLLTVKPTTVRFLVMSSEGS